MPAALATVALIALACGDEEVALDAEKSTSSTPSKSESPDRPSLTPIPDETLLAELHKLPIYPGSTPSDPVYPDGFAFSGSAGNAFSVKATKEDILKFYGSALATEGWVGESEPRDESFVPEGADREFRNVSWSLVNGDLRLLLGVDLTPKDGIPGTVHYGFGVQPIWYPAFDTSGIPAPSTDATPIIIDVGEPKD